MRTKIDPEKNRQAYHFVTTAIFIVANHYNVWPAQILGRCKDREMCRARWVLVEIVCRHVVMVNKHGHPTLTDVLLSLDSTHKIISTPCLAEILCMDHSTFTGGIRSRVAYVATRQELDHVDDLVCRAVWPDEKQEKS